MHYKEITQCRACGSSKLYQYINLHDQPLANSYQDPKQEDEEIIYEFPLKANVCKNCFHSQLSVVVDPDLMYKNYSYVSGTSQTLRDYFDFFAEFALSISAQMYQSRPPRILDIACNDGSQLDAFKRKCKHCETFGVDPAENLVPIARGKGHVVLQDYWNSELSKYLGKMDIITAQNVFAHTDMVLSFLSACRKVMHDQTLLFIQTSQSDMIENGEFDTMYHEHLSFFNVKSMRTLVKRSGLQLEQVLKTNIHGTSYVFIISLMGDVLNPVDHNVSIMEAEEEAAGLYNIDTYVQFEHTAKQCVKELREYIEDVRGNDYKIVGYGAAAKAMTLLNFGGIDYNYIDYIVDDNPLKQGKVTPGTLIPIVSSDYLKNDFEKPILIVPLAWNFFDEIRERVKILRSDNIYKDYFLKYFPTLQLIP